MPVVSIPIAEVSERLGRDLGREGLEPLLDQLGCDVEDFTQIRRLRCTGCGELLEATLNESLPLGCAECGAERADAAALWEELDRVDVVRMDLLPIRPDIFDPGGLTRALRGILGDVLDAPRYELAPPVFTVDVDPAMAEPDSYRPFIRCAVVRGLTLDDISLRQLMKLQELIHWALCRDRKLASIGVYDLGGLQPNVSYRPVDPDDFRFVPLQTRDGKAVTPRQILEEHPKGTAYAHLLARLKRYPILVDEAGQVLSMPPIINSHETRLRLSTTDVFIDVTGVAERAVDKALNTLVTSLLELFPGARAEAVTLRTAEGERQSPDFTPERFTIDVASVQRRLGFPLDAEQAAQLLRQMRHDVTVDGEKVHVEVPAYRIDIMHEVDLAEDIAIAYGYDNIEPTLVPSMTIASERPERVLANRVRAALTGLGFFETMSLMLTNPESHYERLGLPDPGDSVLVEHPVSVEQTMLRTHLLPNLLELFSLNRGQGLPQRFCEVDDVARFDPTEHPEPVERLHVSAGILGTTVGFADIKALVESLGRELGASLTFRPSEHPAFLPGRVAAVFLRDEELGVCGEVHAEVLERLRLLTPLVAMELDLEPLV